MMLVGATGDWTAKTMTNAFPAIRGVYAWSGSTDRVERRRLRLPPQLQPDQPQRRLRLHGPVAAGHRGPEQHPRRRPEPEKPEDLWTFTPRTTRPPDARRPPSSWKTDLIARPGASQLAGSPPATDSAAWEASRLKLCDQP